MKAVFKLSFDALLKYLQETDGHAQHLAIEKVSPSTMCLRLVDDGDHTGITMEIDRETNIYAEVEVR